MSARSEKALPEGCTELLSLLAPDPERRWSREDLVSALALEKGRVQYLLDSLQEMGAIDVEVTLAHLVEGGPVIQYHVLGEGLKMAYSSTATKPMPNPPSKLRKAVPAKVKALLQKEIASSCPFCGNDDVDHFQIHHIDENPINNEYGNLLMVCPNCHSKITKGDISIHEVRRKKMLLTSRMKGPTTTQGNVVNFNAKVQHAILGNNNTITLKAPSRNKYPPGCIGSDTVRANYVGELIDQYNDYKSKEIGKDDMVWGLFGRKLKKRFGIGPTRTIYNVPMTRFDELTSYIQSEIDRTWLARIKRGKGQLKNYKSFEEYCEKYS